MSYAALFEGMVSRLKRHDFRRKIVDKDGKEHSVLDPQAFDELIRAMQDQAPIPLNLTVQLENRTDGNALQILNTGSNAQYGGIEMVNEAGQTTRVGIGLAGTEGLIASELIPNPAYFQDPEVVQRYYAACGDPAAAREIGTGYGQGIAGSGIPGDFGPRECGFAPIGGWGQFFSQIQQSPIVDQYTNEIVGWEMVLNGQRVVWPTGEAAFPCSGANDRLIQFVEDIVIDEDACTITKTTKTMRIPENMCITVEA